jgi:hypothetical protein
VPEEAGILEFGRSHGGGCTISNYICVTLFSAADPQGVVGEVREQKENVKYDGHVGK